MPNMKTFYIKVDQVWEENYVIEAENQQEALTRLYSEDLQPYKNTPTKSEVQEVECYET